MTNTLQPATSENNQLIQKHQVQTINIDSRALAEFFCNIENTIERCGKIELEKYHPVAGRYFKVAVQHERNESYLNKGKKEALKDVSKRFYSQLTSEQRITLEHSRANMRKDVFDAENNRELVQRITAITTETVRADVNGGITKDYYLVPQSSAK